MYRPHNSELELSHRIFESGVADGLKSLAWGGALVLSVGTIAYLLFAHDIYPKTIDGYTTITVAGGESGRTPVKARVRTVRSGGG